MYRPRLNYWTALSWIDIQHEHVVSHFEHQHFYKIHKSLKMTFWFNRPSPLKLIQTLTEANDCSTWMSAIIRNPRIGPVLKYRRYFFKFTFKLVQYIWSSAITGNYKNGSIHVSLQGAVSRPTRKHSNGMRTACFSVSGEGGSAHPPTEEDPLEADSSGGETSWKEHGTRQLDKNWHHTPWKEHGTW